MTNMTDIQHILADVEDIAPVIIIVAIIIINAVAALFKKAKEAAAKRETESAPAPLHSQSQSQNPASPPQQTPRRTTPSKQTQAVQSIADFFGMGEALKIVSEPEPAPAPPKPRPVAKAKPKPPRGHDIAVPHDHSGDDLHRLVDNAIMLEDKPSGPSLGKRLLGNPHAAHHAFIAHELFEPPLALRDDEPRW